MNKADLIERISEVADLTKSVAGDVLDAVFDSITDALKKRENVSILGFGNFTTRERAARMGRNPQTGEAIQIKAAIVPAFKPGKALKDAVQESSGE